MFTSAAAWTDLKLIRKLSKGCYDKSCQKAMIKGCNAVKSLKISHWSFY